MCVTFYKLVEREFNLEKEYGGWRWFISFIILSTIGWFIGLSGIGTPIFNALPETVFEKIYLTQDVTSYEVSIMSFKYTVRYIFAGWLLHIFNAFSLYRHKPFKSIYIHWIIVHIITWPIAVWLAFYIIIINDPKAYKSIGDQYVVWQSNGSFYAMTALQGLFLAPGQWFILKFCMKNITYNVSLYLKFLWFLWWFPQSVVAWVIQLPAGTNVFFFCFMLDNGWFTVCCQKDTVCKRYKEWQNPEAIDINDTKGKMENDAKNAKYEAPANFNYNEFVMPTKEDYKELYDIMKYLAVNQKHIGKFKNMKKDYLNNNNNDMKTEDFESDLDDDDDNNNNNNNNNNDDHSIEEEEKELLTSEMVDKLNDFFLDYDNKKGKNKDKVEERNHHRSNFKQKFDQTFDKAEKFKNPAWLGLNRFVNNAFDMESTIPSEGEAGYHYSLEEIIKLQKEQELNQNDHYNWQLPKPPFNYSSLSKRMPFYKCWRIRNPYTISDIKYYMKECWDKNETIRAMGTQYAWNSITFTRGLLINMSDHLCNPNLHKDLDTSKTLMNKDCLNAYNRYIIVSQSGSTPEMIHNITWPKDKRSQLKDENGNYYRLLRCLPGYHHLALGGLINVGAEGKGRLDRRMIVSMCNQVLSFRLLTFVDPKDNNSEYGMIKEYQIERSSNIIYDDNQNIIHKMGPLHNKELWNDYYKGSIELIQDDDVFNAVICSAGSMGIVFSYHLWLTPAFNVQQYRFVTSWEKYKNKHAGLINLARRNVFHHLEIYLSPYKNGLFSENYEPCVVTIEIKTNDKALPDDQVTDKNAGAPYGSNKIPYIAGGAIVWLSQHLPNFLGWGLDIAVKLTCHKPIIMNALKCEILGSQSCVPNTTAGMIVKLEHCIAAMDRWVKLYQCVDVYGQYKYRTTSPVGITFCDNADGFINMGAQRSTCWLELPFVDYTYKIPKLGATSHLQQSINVFYKALMQEPYYGRFHLAMPFKPYLNQQTWLNSNYYPYFQKWLEIYKQFNYTKRFCNKWTIVTDIDYLAFGVSKTFETLANLSHEIKAALLDHDTHPSVHLLLEKDNDSNDENGNDDDQKTNDNELLNDKDDADDKNVIVYMEQEMKMK